MEEDNIQVATLALAEHYPETSRRHPIDCHVATLTRFPTNNAIYNPRQREACPLPPPPPSKPPKDDSLLWGTMTMLVLAGAGIVTAKNSPEVRDWLTLYAPWADDLIAILYQENMTYGEFAIQCKEDMQKYIASFFEDKDRPKPCALDEKKPIQIPNVPAAPKIKGDEDEEDESLTCDPEPPPVVTQGICEIERCFKEYGVLIDSNYYTAKQACSYYNSLVDETMEDFSYNSLKELHDAKEERETIVKESLSNACDSINRLEEMVRYLDCGVQASKDEIENAKLLFRNFKTQYTASRMQYEWENDKAVARDRQLQIVESLVDKYTLENMALFPGLKYTDKKPHLQGDPDILLYSTLRYVKQLDGELQAANAAISERVNRAYDALPKGQQVEQNRKAQLNSSLAKRSAEIDKNFKDMADQQKQKNDNLLKKLIQEQSERHEAALISKLADKEKEVTAKFNKMVADKVRAEKNSFAAQLSDMSMKLAVVEDKLNVRLKAERETRRSQELWAAAASLLAATKKGGSYINVNRELNAIEKASDGEDKLVLTVLKSIPPSVREKGVVPESVLREKYKVMEQIAMKVSLVEEDGGPMPVYILSWLQSLLLFMKLPGIPQEEFEKPPKEPSKELDTFDLLRRARFWMERGNLAIALRYVNHLQGASRLAAHQWYESARAHLEVRQAAEAVLAHAAAMGLQYI